MKQLLFGCVVMLMTQWACTEKGTPRAECDCPEEKPCTYEFRSIAVRIVDEAGAPVQLHRVRTIRSSTQKEISNRVIDSRNYWQGYYTVVSDSDIQEVSPCGEQYIFEGFMDDKKVVSGEFQVKFDCCHVQKLSGPDQIILK